MSNDVHPPFRGWLEAAPSSSARGLPRADAVIAVGFGSTACLCQPWPVTLRGCSIRSAVGGPASSRPRTACTAPTASLSRPPARPAEHRNQARPTRTAARSHRLQVRTNNQAARRVRTRRRCWIAGSMDHGNNRGQRRKGRAWRCTRSARFPCSHSCCPRCVARCRATRQFVQENASCPWRPESLRTARPIPAVPISCQSSSKPAPCAPRTGTHQAPLAPARRPSHPTENPALIAQSAFPSSFFPLTRPTAPDRRHARCQPDPPRC